MAWEKYLQTTITNNRLIYKIYKEVLLLNGKINKQKTIKYGLNDISPKKTYICPDI